MQIIPPLGAGEWEHVFQHATTDWHSLVGQAAARAAEFFVVDGKGNFWIPTAPAWPMVAKLQLQAVYLGSVGDAAARPQVALFGPQVADLTAAWTPIRDGAGLSPTQAQLFAAGNGLAAFHLEYRFCHACSGFLEVSEGGWARSCPSCGLTVYPRQDPAIIVAIMDRQERLLLAHNANWPVGRVSLVAGFVNMGESAEQTVVREIGEEVGLTVSPSQVQYLTTQTWPFPRSLMLAYKVVVDSPTDPVPDGKEITWASWFSRAEFLAAVASGKVSGPVNRSVAAALVGAWLKGHL